MRVCGRSAAGFGAVLLLSAACDGGGSLQVAPPFVICPLGDTVDFGTTAIGSPRRQHFVLQNSGSTVLLVSRVGVDVSAGDDGAFRAGAQTLTVGPKDTAPLELTFDPVSPGPHQAQLVLENNSNNEPTKVVTLRGIATETETTFVDGGVAYVDGGVAYIDGGVATIDGGVAYVDGGVATIDGGVAYVDGGVAYVDGGVATIDGGVAYVDGGVARTDGGGSAPDGATPDGGGSADAGEGPPASCDAGAPGTIVSGVVANQTWTAGGAPYLVGGDLIVSGVTIEPGVAVRFCGDHQLEVAGPFLAVGSPSAPITFSGAAWGGVYFNGTPAGAELGFCTISGATRAGLRVAGASPLIHNCRIEHNSNPEEGGGVFITGAASAPVITNSVITQNDCEDFLDGGGGVFVGGGAQLTLRNTLIVDNESEGDGAGLYGAGAGAVTVENCVIADNRIEFFANSNMAGGVYSSGSAFTIQSSIIYDNDGVPVLAGSGPAPSITYSTVQNGHPGAGNLLLNPLFSDGAYHLLDPGSPAIDAGDPGSAANDVCAPPSLGGARNDMGAYGGPGACLGTAP